ncbi:hypothetical protein KL925_001885 [Ogataea polymorpha]|nr:hypothetical protein KL925_001885 [Ogataea polymorpha]
MTKEARHKNAHVILDPTCNIARGPLGGRGFESFSEDPYLSGISGAPVIIGIESQGIAATSKHFVCNDLEDERNLISTIVLIVPYNDKRIAVSDGTAAHSPYVIAFERAGIKVLPHVVNALTLCSAWSEANSGVTHTARVLFSLASKKQAPSIFLKTNDRFKVPFVGVALGLVFLALAYMSVDSTAATVFSWFQNITSSNLLLNWILISINHIRMNRALKAQGFQRSDLPYQNRIAPAGAWISLIASIILLITGGFTTFIHGHWKVSTLVSAYCSPVLFTVLYLAWKLVKKSPQIPIEEIIIPVLLEDYRTRPEDPVEKPKGWKILTLLWS